MDLDHGRACRPAIMLHVLFRGEEPTRTNGFAFLRIELVAHRNIEDAGQHGELSLSAV
jgi:hypothetical protein